MNILEIIKTFVAFWKWWIVVWIIAFILGLFLGDALVNKCRAQDPTALNLARCLRAEVDNYSGYRNAEWSAHAWVLKKRARAEGSTLNEMVLRYCAVHNRGAKESYKPRSKRIRRSTFQAPLHGTTAEWAELKRFVDAFIRGKIPDPCPRAIHFGNADDVKDKPQMVEVCKWLGRRGNKFFKVVK
jgi:hypothetical protein